MNISGNTILAYQAMPGFAAWFGIEPEADEGLIAHVTQGLV